MTPEDDDGGLGGELLQISPEEQRRAARVASLFSEEELTRFLQTMLRTFDELGYRQEQRFHFELGLLKLVHLRRLLPVEQVLSALGGNADPNRTPAKAQTPRPIGVPRPAAPPAPSSAPSKPAFSPFEQDKSRRKYDGIQGGMSVSPVVATQTTVQSGATVRVAEPLRAPTPAAPPVLVPPPLPTPLPMPVAIASAPPVKPAEPVVVQRAAVPPSPPPDLPPAPSADATALQRLVVDALQSAKQTSAADAMGDAVWTLTDSEARVQTELSATMLPVVMNPEAEKIARNAARTAGVTKFTLLVGAAGAKKSRNAPAGPPRAGSAKAKAMEHPMVQQAQRLFEAEIQTVIDLSGKD